MWCFENDFWSKWQNRNFLLFSPKNINFDSHLIHESDFVEVWDLRGKVLAHHWNKINLRLDTLEKLVNTGAEDSEIGHIEEGKRNNFTLPASSLPRGSTAQCQERLYWSKNSPIGESESIWMSIQLFQLCRMLPKRPPCPYPIQIKVYVLHDPGMGSNWENSQRSGRASAGCRSSNLFIDSTSLSIFHWVHLAYVSPQLTHGHPQCFM